MKVHVPRVLALVLLTVLGGWLLYWFGYDPPTSAAGWVGAGLAFFIWIMFLLGAFGQHLVRFLRILLGWS